MALILNKNLIAIHFKLIVKCVAIALFYFSCNRTEVMHPISDYLPKDSEIAHRADFKNPITSDFPSLVIDSSSVHYSTISDSSFQNNYDGNLPSKIDIDTNGNVYIVQSAQERINVYDRKGSYRYSIGKPGRGPGELYWLLSFDFSEDYKFLYILDAFEVDIYKLKDNTYEYESSFLHNLVNLNSICVLDDFIYISGFTYVKGGTINPVENRHPSLPIHKFDIDNEKLIASFGYEYRSIRDLPQWNSFMSKTKLACNESTKTIVGQLKDLPYMLGYDTNGEIKWISKFDNFTGTLFSETKRSGLMPTSDVVYYEFQNFREIHSSKYELIQTEYREPDDYVEAFFKGEPLEMSEIEGPEYTTIIVDTENGNLFLSGEYRAIGAIRDNKALLIDNHRHVYGNDNTVLYYEY